MSTNAEQHPRADVGGYWVGQSCTFHRHPGSDIRDASCPVCGGPLQEVAPHRWRSDVHAADLKKAGFEAMMMWSYGLCFPDQDTLENAYLQAMEGTELHPAMGNPNQRYAGGE